MLLRRCLSQLWWDAAAQGNQTHSPRSSIDIESGQWYVDELMHDAVSFIRDGHESLRAEGVNVNVNVYRSPPIASESPWPRLRSSTSG